MQAKIYDGPIICSKGRSPKFCELDRAVTFDHDVKMPSLIWVFNVCIYDKVLFFTNSPMYSQSNQVCNVIDYVFKVLILKMSKLPFKTFYKF